MDIKITNKDVLSIAKYVLKQGKFDDGVVTKAVQKEALQRVIDCYEKHMGEEV